jgi:hypothetical protein
VLPGFEHRHRQSVVRRDRRRDRDGVDVPVLEHVFEVRGAGDAGVPAQHGFERVWPKVAEVRKIEGR